MSQGRRRHTSQLKQESKFPFLLSVYSIRSLKRLGDAQPRVGGCRCSSLLSPPTQILTSSGSALTDTPRNNVFPASGHPWAQSNWPTKWTITMINSYCVVIGSDNVHNRSVKDFQELETLGWDHPWHGCDEIAFLLPATRALSTVCLASSGHTQLVRADLEKSGQILAVHKTLRTIEAHGTVS